MSVIKILLFYNTVRYLRFVQIYFQLWYRIRRYWRKSINFQYSYSIPCKSANLKFTLFVEKPNTYHNNGFRFLNQYKEFIRDKSDALVINWNEMSYGKLWAYNLNYMDYLLQKNIACSIKEEFLHQFVKEIPLNEIGLDPYPISLRGINWIKVFSIEGIRNDYFDASLYAQYKILIDNLEYHLLGNHLLENGFSLLFGAFYFKDQRFFKKANKIITHELNEQILSDGAHFELSPMYHQIILDRVLDCINLTQNNNFFEQQVDLSALMCQKAKQMLSWINAMTFSNGEIPLLNDSATEISPSTSQLNGYAIRLGLITINDISTKDHRISKPLLNASGYRRYDGEKFECIIDVGSVGPTYQPGHAHSDTFNFVLNIGNHPFLVDTGISTYENNKTRLFERGTLAHNTVSINNLNSSQVWSSFRVGKRANVTILKEEDDFISAKHDGFSYLGTIHCRDWIFKKDSIEVHDRLGGKYMTGVAHFLFHPHITPERHGNDIKTKTAALRFINCNEIRLLQIKIPDGFNKFIFTWKVEVNFKDFLNTTIQY